jgi:MFS family permease
VTSTEKEKADASPLLSVFLAAAIFVFVIDTSFMNVSISAVVQDLDTTVSGVQAAVAIEALVSAAFIMISSKLGDLFGRKRAYVAGLLLYAVGALAMVFAQGLAAIIVFWAVIGGLGASLYLPAMQSLIHGNYEGKARAKAYALVGASGAIAAAIGPLIGGFLTTVLSWRVGFLLEALIITVVLVGSRLIHDVKYTGDRSIDVVGSILSVVGMGGIVLGVLVWQEGGESVAALLAIGAGAMAGLVYWLLRRKRQGKATLLDPSLFASKPFSIGVSQIFLQQVALGGMLIVLPIYVQLVWGYNALESGLTLAPLSLTMFGVAVLAGRRAGRRSASSLVRAGFALLSVSIVILIPLVPVADSAWYLAIPLMVAGTGLGLLASQLNNYALSPMSDERVGEAAGVTSATGSFGLSFGLAVAGAVMLATLSIAFTTKVENSTVLPPAEQEQVANALEEDAEVMSDAQLEELLAGEPEAIQDEILSINTDARDLALQVALLVALLAGLIGVGNALRMMRLPDPTPPNPHARRAVGPASPNETGQGNWIQTVPGKGWFAIFRPMGP